MAGWWHCGCALQKFVQQHLGHYFKGCQHVTSPHQLWLNHSPTNCCGAAMPLHCTVLAGTEDGHIHKCSTSYSEQYLETYHGHIGAVYGLQWSPFNPSLFLSCSGDWTIRLWQEGRQQPLMTFQSSNKEVQGLRGMGFFWWSYTCFQSQVCDCWSAASAS